MTAQTAPAPTLTVRPVSFPRVLSSEWVKFWSLRSTYWTVGLTVLAMVAISLLMGSVTLIADGEEMGPPPELVIGIGYSFGQVTIAVLGVMMIASEYTTGQIRSTLAAVPTRVPVLAAKAVLIAVVGFFLGIIGTALSYLVTLPMVGDNAVDLADPEVLRLFWGAGLYLAAIGLLSLGVGALLRHTAGGLALVLGVLLLLPTIGQLLAMWQDWMATVYPYLPTVAGERIAAPTMGEKEQAMGLPVPLEPWTGYGVLLIYVVVVLVAAALLMRRRDA